MSYQAYFADFEAGLEAVGLEEDCYSPVDDVLLAVEPAIGHILNALSPMETDLRRVMIKRLPDQLFGVQTVHQDGLWVQVCLPEAALTDPLGQRHLLGIITSHADFTRAQADDA